MTRPICGECGYPLMVVGPLNSFCTKPRCSMYDRDVRGDFPPLTAAQWERLDRDTPHIVRTLHLDVTARPDKPTRTV